MIATKRARNAKHVENVRNAKTARNVARAANTADVAIVSKVANARSTGVAGVADAANRAEYARLLRDALPRVIRTDQENQRYTLLLERLLYNPQPTVEETWLTELLTLLIEQYEQARYAPPPSQTAGPVDILRHLMDANGLRQADLLDVFGTASVVSEVLSGKRELSKTHIGKLSDRFHVSPALFFPVD